MHFWKLLEGLKGFLICTTVKTQYLPKSQICKLQSQLQIKPQTLFKERVQTQSKLSKYSLVRNQDNIVYCVLFIVHCLLFISLYRL
jgi:hypothetical protein